MKIDYLNNLEPGSKIDVSSFKSEKERLQPEKALAICQKLLKDQATEYNDLVGDNWLNNQAVMNFFDHPDRASDESLVRQQEEQWARESGKDLAQWRHEKERNPANLAEMTLTLMLNKFLPKNFLVVRASAYDDYNHGVDQLILDRVSGNVVCGIDEVIEGSYHQGPSKKEEKIKRQMLKGGFRLKYGARFQDASLLRDSLKAIPAFYLSLKKEELVTLVNGLESEDKMDSEQVIFSRLQTSLLEQISSYETLNLDPSLQANIDNFKTVINNWSEIN